MIGCLANFEPLKWVLELKRSDGDMVRKGPRLHFAVIRIQNPVIRPK